MFNTTLYKIKTHELSLVRKLSPNGANHIQFTNSVLFL